jgi:predicted enzyme related to lactoylglutathione lyase
MANKHTKMNPVVHFEMPAEDRKCMADFYTNVFGWKTQMLGPEMGDYVLATTTEVGKMVVPRSRVPSMVASSQSQTINPRNILQW